jgi:sugar phosphate isomerase/epimerase
MASMRDLSNGARWLSINTATVKERATLRQAVDGLVRHRIAGIAPWRDQVAETGLDEAVKLIRGNGLAVTGLCRGGLFSSGGADGLQAAIDENRRALDEAKALDAACLILVAGGLPPGSRDVAGAREIVRDGIARLLEHSRAVGVPLAIEPLHPMYAADRACVNTLAHANDLCEELGPGVGVAVDVYHLWWDPTLEREIARAGKDRILAFHMSDWLVPTTDLLLDRGMMGDGVIDIPRIRGWVEAAGFEGLCEVEIFSKNNWWKRDPDEVLRTIVERYNTVC